MSNRFWLVSDFQQRLRFGDSITSFGRRTVRLFAWLCFAGMLMVLVLPLSGCHSLPIVPCETVKLPSPPALSQPLPSVTYSEQWRKLAEQSRLRLIDTPAMSKP